MENATNRNYGEEIPNFQQEPETADFELLASGINGHDFQNEEFIDDSPNHYPDYDEEDEEIDLDEDENDEDENEEEEKEDLDNKYDFHPERDIFDQDLLNPFTTDAGL